MKIIKSIIKTVLPNQLLSFLRRYRRFMPAEIKKDFFANNAIEKVKGKTKTNSKIRVGFVVQMPEIWDKESPVYDEMVSDNSFEVDLIVVPPYSQEKQCVETQYDNTNYFLSHYKASICALKGGEWFSLKDGNYDYVFLQRPYDHYLPEGYRSSDIVNFTKLCYVPYGFVGSDVFNEMNTNKQFFRNVYFAFLESEYMAQKLSEIFKTKREKRNHNIEYCGYPALLPYFSFPKVSEYRTFTWTPRWSFDPTIGGSNFLKYKESFIKVVKLYPKNRYVFRPHPLMFGELLVKGIMTQGEIDDYLDLLMSLGVKYDKDTPLEDSLRNTDVLITDFSTIIIQFFLTGRPIIYCESCIKMNETYQKMKPGMYMVNDDTEFVSIIGNLSIEEDYLKSKREELISSGFSIHKNATKNIVNTIKSDYYGEE